jgi:hypothetical protein
MRFQQEIGKTVHQIMEEALDLVHNNVSLPETDHRLLNKHGISEIPSHSTTASDTRTRDCPTNPRAATFVKGGTELEAPNSIPTAQEQASINKKATIAALQGSDRTSERPVTLSSQVNLKQKHLFSLSSDRLKQASSSEQPQEFKEQGFPIATLESMTI